MEFFADPRLKLEGEHFALHGYATSESLALDIPQVHSAASLIEDYRIEAGFYSTGESGLWALSLSDFRALVSVQMGEFPLADLAEALNFETRSMPLFPERPSGRDSVLERIRARRDLIKAKRGILSESVPLIRQQRTRE
jgi:hypothetical protein